MDRDLQPAPGTLRTLIIGGGGRDHALAWSFARSPRCGQLHVAPGNPGIAEVATCHPDADLDDLDGLVALALQLDVDLVVVGMEDHLVAGLASRMHAAGITCLGPTAEAARLEGSKRFSKQLMDELGVPTAAWRCHDSWGDALADIERWEGPVAVKADGLAFGCGAYVCHTQEQARAALDGLFEGGRGTPPGGAVIIEQLLSGREASVMAISDGERVLPLPVARDYKRVFEGDEGPNSGGMGSHCPSTDVDEDEAAALCEAVIRPVVEELARRGTPFRGVVYAGVMLTADGPHVLEYNCRFGNPETQSLVRVLDGDLLDLVQRAATGDLAGVERPGASGAAVAVCVATEHYPELQLEPAPVRMGGLEAAAAVPGVELFTGLSQPNPAERGTLLAAGGRAVTVTARAETFREAIDRAYAAVEKIEIPAARYRRDIGAPALQHARC